MKIKTKNASILGKPTVFHTVGKMDIPEDGIIDVPEQLAKELIEGTSDWIDLSSEEESEAEDSKEPREIAKNLLKQLKVEDLVELAEKFQLDQKKYKNVSKNKPVMLAFLLKNLKDEDIDAIIS